MRVFTPIQIVAALAFASSTLAVDRPAIKDSTIMRSTAGCSGCPDYDCYKCTNGQQKTLKASTGGHAWVRSLVGFQLPANVDPSTITKCEVQFPAFTEPPQYGFNMTVVPALDSTWNEATVTANNAPQEADVIGLVSIPAGTASARIGVTASCQSPDENGQFSIYIGIQEVGYFEIYSKESGNPAILHITQK